MAQLDLLDEILQISEGGKRSLDCLVIADFKNPPSKIELKLGALKAQEIFPKTGRHELEIFEKISLEKFAAKPLKSIWHMEEAIIGHSIVLKMSHVLGDGVSLVLWLKAQLGENVSLEKLELKKFKQKKNSPYKKMLPSLKLFTTKTPSNQRKYQRFSLEHSEDFGPFSLNDFLSLALLDSIPYARKALWVPVNVRQKGWSGFGNGLSRMRIYPPNESLSLKEKLRFIKKQKREAMDSGEIFLAPDNFDIKNPLKQKLIKAWINRPWADWGSLSFSHMHDRGNFFSSPEKIWGITNIPEKLNVSVFAYTKGPETFVTVVSDGEVDELHISHFIQEFRMNFEKIQALR